MMSLIFGVKHTHFLWKYNIIYLNPHSINMNLNFCLSSSVCLDNLRYIPYQHQKQKVSKEFSIEVLVIYIHGGRRPIQYTSGIIQRLFLYTLPQKYLHYQELQVTVVCVLFSGQ